MSIVNALRTSVSGMGAQTNALSAIGDNIANVSTVGYKAAGAQFEAMLAQTPTPTLASGNVQTDVRYGVATQGVVSSTTSSTDFAINGNGFFAVSSNGQGSHLTRAGNFVPDANGNLINAAGYQLMGYNGGSTTLTPVNVAGAVNVYLDSGGKLVQVAANGTKSSAYTIPLATVQSTNNLTPIDGNAYDVSATSGAATLSTAGTNGTGSISSGALEQSTVDLGNELTNMIQTQRSYEANSKVLQTSSDLYSSLKSLTNG